MGVGGGEEALWCLARRIRCARPAGGLAQSSRRSPLSCGVMAGCWTRGSGPFAWVVGLDGNGKGVAGFAGVVVGSDGRAGGGLSGILLCGMEAGRATCEVVPKRSGIRDNANHVPCSGLWTIRLMSRFLVFRGICLNWTKNWGFGRICGVVWITLGDKSRIGEEGLTADALSAASPSSKNMLTAKMAKNAKTIAFISPWNTRNTRKRIMQEDED